MMAVAEHISLDLRFVLSFHVSATWTLRRFVASYLHTLPFLGRTKSTNIKPTRNCFPFCLGA